MRRMSFALGFLFLSVAVVSPRLAGARAEEGKPGLRVFVDPVTGELVSEPTDAQLVRLRSARAGREGRGERRNSWELRRFPLRNGGEGVFLEGWADHELRVLRSEDGGLRVVCSQGDTHARKNLTEGSRSGVVRKIPREVTRLVPRKVPRKAPEVQ